MPRKLLKLLPSDSYVSFKRAQSLIDESLSLKFKVQIINVETLTLGKVNDRVLQEKLLY
jgi:hypothetical protein